MPSLTIDFTPANALRVQDALTVLLNLEAPATMADLKGHLISLLRDEVLTFERRQALRTAAASFDLTPPVEAT